MLTTVHHPFETSEEIKSFMKMFHPGPTRKYPILYSALYDTTVRPGQKIINNNWPKKFDKLPNAISKIDVRRAQRENIALFRKYT